MGSAWLRLLLTSIAWELACAAPGKARYVRKEASWITPTGQIVRPVEAHSFLGNGFDNGTASGQELASVTDNSSLPQAAPSEQAQESPLHGNISVIQEFDARADTEIVGGREATCSISGDPHILTFDAQMSRGRMWHPMFSPGHWWLVRSEQHKVDIQAMYGKCGLKNGRGWMRSRLKGVPRCCIGGFFIGGSFLRSKDGTEHRLIIKSPCDWDWDNMKCRTHQRTPRVIWASVAAGSTQSSVQELSTFVKTDPPVQLHLKGANKLQISLPLGIKVDLYMWGHWRHKSAAHMNAIIKMRQGVAGKQCGHCGNFNGGKNDDNIYSNTGELNKNVAMRVFHNNKKEVDFCDANVQCPERMGPPEGKCKENSKGAAFKMSMCTGSRLTRARQACAKAFKKDHIKADWLGNQELKSCVEDECTGKGFAKADAQGAKDEAKAGGHR